MESPSLGGRHLLLWVPSLRREGDAVAWAACDADLRVLGEAVQERCGELVVAEDAVPFAEGEVRGDDRRGALVTVGEHVEEQLPAGLLKRYKSKLVEEQ